MIMKGKGIIQGAIELYPSDWLRSRLMTPHIGSDGSQCNSQTLLMGLSNGTTNLKSHLAVSLRLNIHLPCDSAIPFLGIYPREMKTYVLQKAGIRTFRAALFIIAPNWKQPKCPSTGGWINKPWCIHTIKLILSSKKNEQLIHATTLINIKNIMLSHTLANYGPQAKSSPPSVFITKCSWNTAAPLHVWLSTTALVRQPQSWGVETEAEWHAKPRVFTVWFLI